MIREKIWKNTKERTAIPTVHIFLYALCVHSHVLFFFTWCIKSQQVRLLFYPLRRATKHLLWVSNKSLLTERMQCMKGEKQAILQACIAINQLTNSLNHLSIPSPSFSTIRRSLTSWHMLQVHLSWSADLQSTQLCRNFTFVCCMDTLFSQCLLPSLLEKLTQQPLSGPLNFVMLDLLLPGVLSARAP